jgi:hypothetical protein
VVTIPGLIQQLREMAVPGSAEEGPGAKSAPDSKPPVALEAVSLLASIEHGTRKRLLDLQDEFAGTDAKTRRKVEVRPAAEDNVRAYVAAAAMLDSGRQSQMLAELRSWRRQAEVVCRWQAGAVELVAPCPAPILDPRTGTERPCGARGSLLANPDTEAARCITCGAEWSPEESGQLFAHVKAYTEGSRAVAEKARVVVREAKAKQRNLLAEALKRREGVATA